MTPAPVGTQPISAADIYSPATFWSRVDRQGGDECWRWRGNTQYGYGRYKVLNRARRAHRVAYALWYGHVGANVVLDHLCRNTLCVNPLHLEATTIATNTARGVGPTAEFARGFLVGVCKNGHDLAIAGVQIHGGRRNCGQCSRDRAARYKRRAKVAS